jgi:hypothetical protein
VESLQVKPRSVTDDPFLSATIPGYLGSAYDFSCDYQFNTARMTFTYDTSLGTIGEDFQPRIYHYNEELGCFELLANQTVTDGAVSVDVKHFSTYVLLNKVLFDDAWEFIRKPITDAEGNSKGIDLLFVVDVSMSMEGDRLLIAQEACKEYIGALNSDDRVGLVSFCGSSTIHSGLTYDHAAVEAQVVQQHLFYQQIIL